MTRTTTSAWRRAASADDGYSASTWVSTCGGVTPPGSVGAGGLGVGFGSGAAAALAFGSLAGACADALLATPSDSVIGTTNEANEAADSRERITASRLPRRGPQASRQVQPRAD